MQFCFPSRKKKAKIFPQRVEDTVIGDTMVEDTYIHFQKKENAQSKIILERKQVVVTEETTKKEMHKNKTMRDKTREGIEVVMTKKYETKENEKNKTMREGK